MAGSRAGLEGERCVRPLAYGQDLSRRPRSLFTFSDAQHFFNAFFQCRPVLSAFFSFSSKTITRVLKTRLVYGLILFLFFFFLVFFFVPRGRR